jgi:hypothetical protein
MHRLALTGITANRILQATAAHLDSIQPFLQLLHAPLDLTAITADNILQATAAHLESI